ncbi:MAG: hypothetical protein ACLT50_05875 [Mediterraneibacter faecis]
MTPDVNIILMDFPKGKGHEMVVPNEDGSYTIFINAALNYESQQAALKHAMSHIENDDFYKEDVQEIEYLAHTTTKAPDPVISAYSKCMEQNRTRRKRGRRRRTRDTQRIDFIREHCDTFRLAEYNYLYGKDL